MSEATPAGASAPATEGHAAGAPTRVFGGLFPMWARAFVRTREAGLVIVALLIGAVSGLLVTGMSVVSQLMHEFLFGLPRGLRLSLAPSLEAWRAVAVVTGGTL